MRAVPLINCGVKSQRGDFIVQTLYTAATKTAVRLIACNAGNKRIMKYCLLLIMFFQLVANAQDVKTYEPANLKDSGLSFKNIIKFPSVKWEGTMIIRCDAYISHLGEFLSNYCFDRSAKAFPFVSAVNTAARNGKIKPAKVNGASRPVWFQYYVVFTKKEKKTLIEVVQNSGLQAATFGTEYTSAQRYKEDSGNFAVGCGTAYQSTLMVKTIIGKDGKAKGTEVDGKDVTQTCKDNLIRDFAEQEFIPAFVDGKAVDSFYAEDVFNRYRKE